MNGNVKNTLIALDTNIFIYYFQQHPQFGSSAKDVFESLTTGKAKGITSIITLIELLSLTGTQENTDKLKALFLETPNLAIFDVTQIIGIEAARIRRNYGYRLPDSIQLATSLFAKAKTFITNDSKLLCFKEINVRMLDKPD